MKKIILGFFIGLTITGIAAVSPGNIIKADLLNKILDIEVSTGDNVCSAQFSLSGTSYILDNNSCSNLVTMSVSGGGTTTGSIDVGYSDLNLTKVPTVIATIYHHGGVTAFSSITYRGKPGVQSTGFYTASASSVYNPSYIHVTLERMGSDRFPRKTIRQIILDLVPTFFD